LGRAGGDPPAGGGQPVPLHARLRAAGGGPGRLRVQRPRLAAGLDRRRGREPRLGGRGRVHRGVLLARRNGRGNRLRRLRGRIGSRGAGARGATRRRGDVPDRLRQPGPHPRAAGGESQQRAPTPPLGPELPRPHLARKARRAPGRRRLDDVATVVAAERGAARLPPALACSLPRSSGPAGRRPGRDRLPQLDGGAPHGARARALDRREERAGGGAPASPPRPAGWLDQARPQPPGGSRRIPLEDRRPRGQAHPGARRGRAARRADLRRSPLLGTTARPRQPTVPPRLAAHLGAVSQPAIVQVKRVSVPRGASPPGRTPRRTSTAGVVVCVASAVLARPRPSRRQRSVRPTTIVPAPAATSTSASGSGSTRTGSVATPSARCTAIEALASNRLASRPSAPAVAPASWSATPRARASQAPSSTAAQSCSAPAKGTSTGPEPAGSSPTTTPTSHGA